MAPIVSALSPEPAERTNIATTRTVFSNLGSLTASLFTLPLVYHFAGVANSDAFAAADATAKAAGYRNTNIVLGIMVVVIFIICVFSITEINPPSKVTQKTSFLEDMSHVFNSKYFILMVFECYVLFVGYLGMYGAMQYYYTYIVGDLSAMSLGLSLLTICAIPTMLVAAFLNGRGMAKIKIILFGTAVDAVGYLILYITSNATVATLSLALIGLGFGFRQAMYFSMLPDMFDYTEWKFGKNMGGTQNAITGFANKLASASASAIISALLVWGSYNGEAMDAALASGQNLREVFPTAMTAINFAFGGLSLVATILAFLILLPYDLDKKMPQIRADIAKRQETAS